jgi:hypothetical protein
MKLTVTLGIMLCCGLLNADSVVHRFELWEIGTERDKSSLYLGWTNGFMHRRGPKGGALADCLETMATKQAVAMVDKYYKDHPEKWSDVLAGNHNR